MSKNIPYKSKLKQMQYIFAVDFGTRSILVRDLVFEASDPDTAFSPDPESGRKCHEKISYLYIFF